MQQKSLPITISANGTIKPERMINLSPKTSGYLKQLLVREGDRVQEGQIVAYMDDSNLQGQLTQARAQLAQQEANLNKLLNGTRTEEIAQAQAQLDEARARLRQLETGNRTEEIDQAQAQLTKAQADLRLAEDDLQRYQSLFTEGAIAEQTVVQKRSVRDVAMILMENIQKNYQLGETPVPILKGIHLSIEDGEYVAIMGAAGSGESTLMNIMGCLDRASEGRYLFEGEDLTTFNADELAYVRNQRIGFVFQQFNLLSRATALENVMLPMIYANVPKSERRDRATEALIQVGLTEFRMVM